MAASQHSRPKLDFEIEYSRAECQWEPRRAALLEESGPFRRHYRKFEIVSERLKEAEKRNKQMEKKMVGPSEPVYRTSKTGDVCPMVRERMENLRRNAIREARGQQLSSSQSHIGRIRNNRPILLSSGSRDNSSVNAPVNVAEEVLIASESGQSEEIDDPYMDNSRHRPHVQATAGDLQDLVQDLNNVNENLDEMVQAGHSQQNRSM
ncbi:uncharacterized protein [Pleurodeles waltl]|uniref:uncharacterized protein n=1 Tax=Pleurodeles waltl TaxID=8319 RepID=UPI00370958F1